MKKQKPKRKLKLRKKQKTQNNNCVECGGECAETGVCKHEANPRTKVKKKKVKLK